MSEEKVKDVLSSVVNGGDDIYKKINTVCLILIAAVCMTSALIYTKSIMIPLVISIFIYTMITPIIRFFRYKFKFPHWLAIIGASIVVIIPITLLIIFLINSITSFVQVSGTYQAKLVESFNWVISSIKSYNIPLPEEALDMQSIISLISGQQMTNFLKGFGGVTLQILTYSTVVFVFVFFFLIGNRADITNSTIKEVQNKISAYLYIHIIISLMTGILVGIVYFFVGLELALMFVILTVILNFIPNVGSVLAVALPLPIAIIQFGFGPQFWIVLIIPSCTQFMIGSILEPKLLGTGLDLHPVAIIGSLIFWALIWGIPGAFLAVPITSALRLILSRLEPTRPFAEMLAGRLPK
jgi:AI-2 transport protein TqsA